MGPDVVRDRFIRYAAGTDLAIVEGNRGLFDGVDARGTHSTAELAKAIDAPLLLVVDATKATRTIAALVLGCQRLDPDVRLAGVVLNRVSSRRHEGVIREAVESVCGIPIVGAVPRVSDAPVLPGRHLGLVPPAEHGGLDAVDADLLGRLGQALDLEAILRLARSAAALPPPAALPLGGGLDGCGLRIGYLCDSAFTFYYPENLEQLREAGADLVPISSLTDAGLPPGLHGLYIRRRVPGDARRGPRREPRLPGRPALVRRARVADYAECGGLMLLAGSLRQGGEATPMAGVLPFAVELSTVPRGHGYAELTIDTPNPFFPVGLSVRGHEFHYSRIVPGGGRAPTVAAVRRGTGSVDGRDGIVVGNVWASYVHVHAAATRNGRGASSAPCAGSRCAPPPRLPTPGCSITIPELRGVFMGKLAPPHGSPSLELRLSKRRRRGRARRGRGRRRQELRGHMTTALYVRAGALGDRLLVATVVRAVGYARCRSHLRWELYPVPHEEAEGAATAARASRRRLVDEAAQVTGSAR